MMRHVDERELLPDGIDVETPDCPLCGSVEFSTRYSGRDRLVGKPGAFPVVQCDGCGFVYLRPRPTVSSIGFYYPETYFPLRAGEEEPEAIAEAQGLLHKVKSWNRQHGLDGGRLLDLGCGTGLFLRMARDDGFDVQGVEIGDRAAEFARSVYGVPVITGDILDVDLPVATFDIITMWHVLEHMFDPVAVLTRVRQLLRPGGVVLFGVPNITSIEERIFGRRWFSLDVPRHLGHFSPETAERTVIEAGLRLERIDHSRSTAGLVYSIMGDVTGVSLKLRDRDLSDQSYRRAVGALTPLARPICVAFARLGCGGAIEVYAVRDG